LFSSWICFLFVFYSALKFKNFFVIEFFYSIPLGLLFGSFCVTIGSYCVIVWLFSSSCLSSITLVFDFFWVVIWFLLGCCSYPLVVIQIFLLLFNTSNIIIWPNVIQLISSLKYLFDLVPMCDYFSLHYFLASLVMLLIN
jgi:hypothetical protein